MRAAHGVGCSWEGVQTLLWVSDKGVLATEVVQLVAQRFAFQVVLPQSSGRLFLPGLPEWFSFCPQATVGPQSVFAGGRAGGKDSSADRAVALEAGVPFLPPQPRPQRGGQVLCGGCACPSGSGCRSPRCRGAAGGGLLEGRVGGWTGREDGRAG